MDIYQKLAGIGIAIFVIGLIVAFIGIGYSSVVENAENQKNKAEELEDVNSYLDIQRFHDDEMNVTCWYSDSGTLSVPPTISCIPDSQLKISEK